jgi:hypothetical protein
MNPKNATRLKMVGRWREEEVAERLRKPASDTEAGGLGSAGDRPGDREVPAPAGRGLSPPRALKGARTPREVPTIERSSAEAAGHTV